MRRPQRSELTRSESCQSGPASSTTTFLPAFASVAANTEPEAPAPTMTASTFGRVAMSPPLQRHDVRLIRNAEELVAFDRAVDDVDCVASHEEVDEGRGRSLPALELPLSHEIDEVALRVAWQPGEALIRLRGGSAVDRRDRRFVEIRVRRAHVHDARLKQRLFGRHRDLLIDEMRDAGGACAGHQLLAHRLERFRLARLQQTKGHALCARRARREQNLCTADGECERAERAAHEVASADHGCLLPGGQVCGHYTPAIRCQAPNSRARSVDELIALEERIRTGEVADIGGVADDAHAAPPGMKLERRRLHLEARRGIRREIQRHLVRRARAGGCDRAGEAVLDRPMQMAAQEALDLRMPRDHFRERLAALEADAIHVSDERRKW